MIRRSVAGRLLFWLLPLFGAAIALPLLLLQWLDDAKLVGVLSALVIVPLAVWVIRRALAAAQLAVPRAGRQRQHLSRRRIQLRHPLARARRPGRPGARARANWATCCAPSARAWCERELLLDTMVQNTPVAMLLVAAGGDGERRVVFANLAARKLLHSGWKLEGQRFDDLLAAAPVEMREAMQRGGDGLFAIGSEEDDETKSRSTTWPGATSASTAASTNCCCCAC